MDNYMCVRLDPEWYVMCLGELTHEGRLTQEEMMNLVCETETPEQRVFRVGTLSTIWQCQECGVLWVKPSGSDVGVCPACGGRMCMRPSAVRGVEQVDLGLELLLEAQR